MLSMSMPAERVQNSRPSLSTGGGSGGVSGDERADGSVQRLESLKELLVAALHYHPDLPLGLCVKSKSALFFCFRIFVILSLIRRRQICLEIPPLRVSWLSVEIPQRLLFLRHSLPSAESDVDRLPSMSFVRLLRTANHASRIICWLTHGRPKTPPYADGGFASAKGRLAL